VANERILYEVASTGRVGAREALGIQVAVGVLAGFALVAIGAPLVGGVILVASSILGLAAVLGYEPATVGSTTIDVLEQGIRLRGGVEPLRIPWSDVREITLQATNGHLCTVRVRAGRIQHRVDGVELPGAYRLRHAAAFVGGVREPDDVRVDEVQEWNRTRFDVHYPLGRILVRRVCLGPEGIEVAYGEDVVAAAPWSAVRRLLPTGAGEVTWRDDDGQHILTLVPPSVAAAVLETSRQYLADLDRRETPGNAEALRRLAALRRSGVEPPR